jgi:HEAT repeat protein
MNDKKAVDVLAVLDRARDVLAEIYAKHQRAIGPFATQAQKSNGSLREARAAVAELIRSNDAMKDEIRDLENELNRARAERSSAETALVCANEGLAAASDLIKFQRAVIEGEEL